MCELVLDVQAECGGDNGHLQADTRSKLPERLPEPVVVHVPAAIRKQVAAERSYVSGVFEGADRRQELVCSSGG